MAVIKMVEINGEAVRKAMQKRGYTRHEIADELSYSSDTSIDNALKRGRIPSVKFQKLVRLLHVPEEELLSKTETPEKPKQECLPLENTDLAEIKTTLSYIKVILEDIHALMFEASKKE
jgi:transcriptional regulator with XRE-family HTH domain